ncbi:cysteine-rich receptor-like protein kinase 2 [Rutidosis leptorrhynchoides]|uniref:cysteine-rich receptor-like protein kinase 2 n=1 Tax=Rutidosis leptorrhynchoides TaxID=125765 RepID=UPI003A99DE7C
MMAVLIVLLVLLQTKIGTSQSNVYNNDTNIHIFTYCGSNSMSSESDFNKTRNSTLDELRTNLLSKRDLLYARSQAFFGQESLFALAQCRNYLSIDQCVDCFDVGVSELVKCTGGNGAYVTLDNCFIRYEGWAGFYNDPYVMMVDAVTPPALCGNQSSTSSFNQGVNGLLSDIRDATPKTSDFYVASSRQITNENETQVYAIAQCVENISQDICQTCMNTAYTKISDCLPSTEGRYFEVGCFMRYSYTRFFNDNQTTDISRILKRCSSKVTIIAGAVGGVVFVLLIFLLWLLYRLRMKTAKAEQGDMNGLVNYSSKDLLLATSNFSQENILGKGGFGMVFKAILDDKRVVAVKKLEVRHARAKEEFENEIKLMSLINHRNLLRLLGWSSESDDLLLVMEYMANGSLDRFLWGDKRGTLDWNQRYEIIYGTARGLAYLHNEFHIKIVHRDIKSSNILLTDDFKPKIADFGLARSQSESQTHVITNFAGTLGYTAPEYALGGLLSDKVDTYSFGVVILEIISGRRSTEVLYDRSSAYLLEHAWKLYENNTHTQLIDETLELNHIEREHVMNITEIALSCTQSRISDRPSMSEVALMLQDGQSIGVRRLTRSTFGNNQDRRIHVGTS